MGYRPNWNESYWKNLDKETRKTLRTQCPRCGSTKTYYNKQSKVWRCGRCEAAFTVKGLDERPWWRRIFRR